MTVHLQTPPIQATTENVILQVGVTKSGNTRQNFLEVQTTTMAVRHVWRDADAQVGLSYTREHTTMVRLSVTLCL